MNVATIVGAKDSTFIEIIIKPFVQIVVDIINAINSINKWADQRDWPIISRNIVHAAGILIALVAGFVVYALVPAVQSWFMQFFTPFALGEGLTRFLAGYFAGHVFGYVADFVIDATCKLIFQTAFGDAKYFLTPYQREQLALTLAREFNQSIIEARENAQHLEGSCRKIIYTRGKAGSRREWEDMFDQLKSGNPRPFLRALRQHQAELAGLESIVQPGQYPAVPVVLPSEMLPSARAVDPSLYGGGAMPAFSPGPPLMPALYGTMPVAPVFTAGRMPVAPPMPVVLPTNLSMHASISLAMLAGALPINSPRSGRQEAAARADRARKLSHTLA